MRRLRRFLDALGPAGVAGIGVLLFCMALYGSSVLPAQEELQHRTAAAERQRARPAAQPVAAGDAAGSLARFYAQFPAADGLTGELERVYAHARASNLQLQQGDYQLDARGAGLAVYRVILPVRGSYGDVRRFVARVLRDMPTASLDALRFERKKSADAQLEAQVRLTIYLQKKGS